MNLINNLKSMKNYIGIALCGVGGFMAGYAGGWWGLLSVVSAQIGMSLLLIDNKTMFKKEPSEKLEKLDFGNVLGAVERIGKYVYNTKIKNKEVLALIEYIKHDRDALKKVINNNEKIDEQIREIMDLMSTALIDSVQKIENRISIIEKKLEEKSKKKTVCKK